MALETWSPTILRFGTFEVDLRAGELRKQGVKIKVQEQPFQVLAALLKQPEDVVTREELRKQIWPEDTFVDFDNSLNIAINKLREALGDSADNPRFIETLPRRGYRFIAPVTGNDRKELAARGPAVAVRTQRRKIGLGVPVVVLVAAAGGFLWHSRQSRVLSDKDTIVLADFVNKTGDAVFDDALKQALRVELEQSPFLNVLSDQQVDEELKLMARSAGERLTPELARELCQRVGSKAVLKGSISQLGTHYIVGLNAFNCHTGEELGNDQVEAEDREHVLQALGKSTTKMRERLGESLASIQNYDAPVQQVTTASLEALQAYSVGIKARQAKGGPASLPFFKRAVELDPNFAMAYGKLGLGYGEAGEAALLVENTRKAYELRANVSQRERLYLESHYYHYATGEMEKATQVYELWEQIYPHDDAPHDNLEDVDSSLGNHERALEEALKALQLAPNKGASYEDVSRSYLRLTRLTEAQAVLKSAEQRGLESGSLFLTRYQVALLKDDREEMQRLVASTAGKWEGLLLYLQGYTQAYFGRLVEARALWRRSQESFKDRGSVGFAAYVGVDAGIAEALLGDVPHAREDIYGALNLAETPQTRSMAALGLALAHDNKQAEKLVSSLRKDYPVNSVVQRYSLPMVRATTALEHKNPQATIELLSTMNTYEWSPSEGMEALDPMYLRGQAWLMLGDGRAAATEFQKILDHPGLVLENPAGALAHLGLARAYALQGDSAKARAAYYDFLTRWKDADPDIPILKQAKAEYAKLE